MINPIPHHTRLKIKTFSVEFSHTSNKTLLHLFINQVKITKVPFCKLNPRNWHSIQFGLVHIITTIYVLIYMTHNKMSVPAAGLPNQGLR